MRKVLMAIAVVFAMATVSQANPSNCVTGTLGSFVSLGTTGCSINGNVVTGVSTNLRFCSNAPSKESLPLTRRVNIRCPYRWFRFQDIAPSKV